MPIGAIDLFCGVGGLTCGIRLSGINVIAGIDFDESCKYAYEYNNKAQFFHRNIQDVTGKEIRNIWGDTETTMLMGCAPCQPFSNHQKDKRNRNRHKDWGLLYQFARLIEESNPDIVSMENVPELRKEKVFNDFVAKLNELGYFVHYEIINAADYGVPQRRNRLLLLGYRNHEINFIPPTHKEQYVTVADVISNLPQITAGQICPVDRLHCAPKLSETNLRRIRISRPGGTWREWPEDLILNCHRKEAGATYSSVYGRMKWDDVAPTITTQFTCYGTGRFGHPEQDRAITLREGAMLQTFSRDYEFVPPEERIVARDIARHIGNAVPPRLGEVIGLSIIHSI